ncbi:hypothetical protein NQ176_g2186 [Zarea fungicola]|uniref:Uncharacterized protein n=1 Tax=Zarea fungicola TaxID=93591 RepID=A0ACC1NQ13_9HYPO|nr:hypothetical protein NQ176_g2186 [Lecanicillium fungicola]
MSGNFQFINGLEQDSASRKLLRRHVMMGKNAGKRINRPSKKALRERQDQQKSMQKPVTRKANFILGPKSSVPNNAEAVAYWIYISDRVIGRTVDDRIDTFSLPVTVPREAMNVLNVFFTQVVDHIYAVNLGLSLHNLKFLWLQTICIDSDAFKGCISLMSACNNLFLGDAKDSTLSLYHLFETIKIVRRRLAGDQALSNSTIAIVLSLVQQEQMRNEFDIAHTHAKGLGKLIELRGGIEKIESDGPQNELLVMKLCKTDIILALQYGEPLMFYRDRMTEVRKAISAEGLHLDSIALSSPSTAQQIDPCLKQTLQDVMGLCALFNNGLQGHKMELVTYVAMLTSLLYRLLHFRSIGSSPHTSSANSAHHIGLVIFIGMLFIQRGSRQILQCDLLNQRVKQVVKSDLQDCSDNFAFWIMMTAGIWIDDGEIAGMKRMPFFNSFHG